MRSPSAAFRLRRRGWRPRQPEPPLPKGGCPSAHTGAGGYVFPASPPSGGESLRRHLHLRKKPLDGSAPGRLRIRPKHVLRFACTAGRPQGSPLRRRQTLRLEQGSCTTSPPSPPRGRSAVTPPLAQRRCQRAADSRPYGGGRNRHRDEHCSSAPRPQNSNLKTEKCIRENLRFPGCIFHR